MGHPRPPLLSGKSHELQVISGHRVQVTSGYKSGDFLPVCQSWETAYMASSQVRWHQLLIIVELEYMVSQRPTHDNQSQWLPLSPLLKRPPSSSWREESHISWSHALSSVTMPTSRQAFISGPGNKATLSVLSWQEPIFAICSYPMLVLKKFLVTFWSWQVRSQRFGTYFWLKHT